MADINQLSNFRPLGIALLATVIIFLVGAWSAAYFRQWPLPDTPLEKLILIANDRVGWTAQAIIFPVAFLATAVLSGLITANLPGGWPRWLAAGATLLFAAGFLLWLPISVDRLRLGAQAAELIRRYDPAAPPAVMVNPGTLFWSHTYCILAALALMGAAFALSGVLPTLGWVVSGLAVAAVVLAAFVMHDWPPFMSYVILLALAVGLMRAG
jgi:hypothetical protein